MAATTAPPARTTSRVPRSARRVGYGIAVAANVFGIWIVNHLLDWGWPRFLTEDFDIVVPLITLSFAFGVVANLIYMADDAPWLKSLGNIVTGLVSLVVSIRVWQVFPFDFSTYSIDWTGLMRAFLVVAIVGTIAGVITEVARLVSRLVGHDPDDAEARADHAGA